MTTFRPFRAVRPREDLVSSIAALPYDVYSSAEAKKIVSSNPLSFLKIDRAETLLPEGTDMYSRAVYEKARDTLNEMIADGSFIQDETPCFYLYALTMDGRTQTGIAGCASIDDYESGGILKHENTLEAKELDRIHHVETCSAHTGPIFLACRPVSDLKALSERICRQDPIYDFVSSDGIRHQVWRVDQAEDVSLISHLFTTIPHLYIADGHHRAASAVKAGLRRRAADPEFTGDEEYNFFLSVVFPSDELNIYDYNRAAADKNNYTTGQLLDMIGSGFDITTVGSTPFRPARPGEFGMYLDHCWYALRARDALLSQDPVKGLDVSILQDHILEPVLGITDPKNNPRIRFIGGIRGLHALEEAADADGGVSFSMYPTSMEELMAVADAGLLMPPKSTWFEPKLRSGLFIHRF